MRSSGVGQVRERSISERLKAATDELQNLEQLVVSGDCSPRVLSEFRGAVDSMRQTAWAVQQWIELQREHRDPYTVLGLLSPATHDTAVEILSLPDRIRGYGPVKEKAVHDAKARYTQLAADLVNPPPAPRQIAAE